MTTLPPIGTHQDPESTLGTVNGYARRLAVIKGQVTAFNGTTLGLARAAAAAGLLPGDTLWADYGVGPVKYQVTATGGGDRTPGGIWVDRVREETP